MVECGGGSCILYTYVVVVVICSGGTFCSYLQVDNAGLDPISLALVVYTFVPPTSADSTCTYAYGGPIAFCNSSMSDCVVHGGGDLCIVVVEY